MNIVKRTLASGGGSAIAALLGLAFLVSCWLLAVHVVKADKPDFTVVSELMLVAVLSLEGVVAVQHLRQSQLEGLHALFDVRREYQAAEMTLAIATLWRFRQQHGDRFVEVYLETWRRDEEHIAALPAAEQVEEMRGTLHYRRRLVKEFYDLLAGLYELKVLPKDVVYTYWVESELRIIPEILIPLESAVAQNLRGEKELGPWLQRLRRLYDDCPENRPVRAGERLSKVGAEPHAGATRSR
jgi:hypothetical protein